MENFVSIPFKTETEHGLSSVRGVAKFSSAGIVIEFEKKLFGLISNGYKEARLPIDDILDVTFKKGWLKRGAHIDIRLRSLMQFDGLPLSEGKLKLTIDRLDFERSRTAVSRLQEYIQDRAASLPPPNAAPVRSLFDDE
jgi:hypothetical protein